MTRPRKLIPVNEMSSEAVRQLREKTYEYALRAVSRREGCVGCPRVDEFTSAQVMNRLADRIASYCCELAGVQIKEESGK